MDEIEERLVKVERNNLVFRIGVILTFCGVLLVTLGEISLYNETLLVLRWTYEMALSIGGCMFLFGLGLIVLATLSLEKVYGIGK